MIYYLLIGLVYSFFHNYNVLFVEKENFIYKVWSYFLVTLLFPLPVFVFIMDSNAKTEKILDNIITTIVGE